MARPRKDVVKELLEGNNITVNNNVETNLVVTDSKAYALILGSDKLYKTVEISFNSDTLEVGEVVIVKETKDLGYLQHYTLGRLEQDVFKINYKK